MLFTEGTYYKKRGKNRFFFTGTSMAERSFVRALHLAAQRRLDAALATTPERTFAALVRSAAPPLSLFPPAVQKQACRGGGGGE